MTLAQGEMNKHYVIEDIKTVDDQMKTFLFSLGCYSGETVTIISKLAGNFVVNIKGARYSIDENLANAILV